MCFTRDLSTHILVGAIPSTHLHGEAQRRGCAVGHLDACEHASGGDGEVEVCDHLGRGRLVDAGQALLRQLVRVQDAGPLARCSVKLLLLKESER